ncbi:MAG: HD-GYP domain-containing protein [Candidatus Omnitrophota bacterium]
MEKSGVSYSSLTLWASTFPGAVKKRIARVFIKAVRRLRKIEIRLLNSIFDRSGDRMREHLNVVKTLAKIIDANDPYTRGHCDKVMKHAVRICRKMKLPKKQTDAIKTASQLHDIGKLGIDLNILRKSTPLNEEDWQAIKLHPEIGARIIQQTGFFKDIVPMIRHHHARYDGGGYPDASRKNSKIPLGARIIAVADAFDAMTSNRPYRKAMSTEEATAELRKCAGAQFDPQVVNAFLAL